MAAGLVWRLGGWHDFRTVVATLEPQSGPVLLFVTVCAFDKERWFNLARGTSTSDGVSFAARVAIAPGNCINTSHVGF